MGIVTIRLTFHAIIRGVVDRIAKQLFKIVVGQKFGLNCHISLVYNINTFTIPNIVITVSADFNFF